MKTSIDELSLPTLRARAFTVEQTLREARRHLASVDGLSIADDALDGAERLLPGLLAPDRSSARKHLALVERLRHPERLALRASLDADADAGAADGELRAHPALSERTAAEILDAIARVEILDSLERELFALLGAIERSCVSAA